MVYPSLKEHPMARFMRLRLAMTMEQLDYYVIPSRDAHGVVDPKNSTLDYGGKLSLAMISKTAAYLFVDHSEFTVAEERVVQDRWFVIPIDMVGSPDYWATWLASQAEKATVGIDPYLIWDDTSVMLRSLLAVKESHLKTPEQNLIDRILLYKVERSSILFPSCFIEPSSRLGQVQYWIMKQSPSTVISPHEEMSMQEPSGALVISSEDISFLMHLDGAD
ncbi:hypothetical protein JAAARDRAFT_188429 [Jaapia argillacea MUCL 33604]|uniref:Creatinase N-terminal domain-containing protein n=1 Tax=Jaapia argillacea MUCL 33604 TaxID=933084 RepID=A0A067QR43_9AGAM|nr:hypothetical protein JAAARDRAFT_188429 [Jaapia argillacea MUCL 33604]